MTIEKKVQLELERLRELLRRQEDCQPLNRMKIQFVPVAGAIRAAKTTHELATISRALKEAAIREQSFDLAAQLRTVQKSCESIPSQPLKWRQAA